MKFGTVMKMGTTIVLMIAAAVMFSPGYSFAAVVGTIEGLDQIAKLTAFDAGAVTLR